MLIDEDDGAGCAAGVGGLGSAISGHGGGGGDGSGRHHDDGVGAGGDVDVAGVGGEGEIGDDGGHAGEFLSGRDGVDIDGRDACGLIDETQGDLSGGSGLALIFEDDFVEAGGGVSDECGVLAGGGEGGGGRGEDLGGAGGFGGDGVRAGVDGDVGGDGAEAEVVGEDGCAFVHVEAGCVRGGIDDADLRAAGGTDDALASCERGEESYGRKGDGETDGAPCGEAVLARDRHTSRLRMKHRYVSL